MGVYVDGYISLTYSPSGRRSVRVVWFSSGLLEGFCRNVMVGGVGVTCSFYGSEQTEIGLVRTTVYLGLIVLTL